MIIPAADTPRKVLEMRGEPVNPGTLGQEVIADNGSTPADGTAPAFFSTFFAIVGKVIMAIFGLIGTVVGITALVGAIVLATCMICYYGYEIPVNIFGGHVFDYTPLLGCVSILIWMVVGIIASGALVWAACSVLFNAPGASRATKISYLIMEIILIAAGIATIAIATA